MFNFASEPCDWRVPRGWRSLNVLTLFMQTSKEGWQLCLKKLHQLAVVKGGDELNHVRFACMCFLVIIDVSQIKFFCIDVLIFAVDKGLALVVCLYVECVCVCADGSLCRMTNVTSFRTPSWFVLSPCFFRSLSSLCRCLCATFVLPILKRPISKPSSVCYSFGTCLSLSPPSHPPAL